MTYYEILLSIISNARLEWGSPEEVEEAVRFEAQERGLPDDEVDRAVEWALEHYDFERPEADVDLGGIKTHVIRWIAYIEFIFDVGDETVRVISPIAHLLRGETENVFDIIFDGKSHRYDPGPTSILATALAATAFELVRDQLGI